MEIQVYPSKIHGILAKFDLNLREIIRETSILKFSGFVREAQY